MTDIPAGRGPRIPGARHPRIAPSRERASANEAVGTLPPTQRSACATGIRLCAGHATESAINLLDDPAFFPFQLDLDAGRVLFVRLDDAARAEAPFLDQRALSAAPEGYWLPLDALLAHPVPPTAPRLDWIFHIGHCGSTLLSRLLQEWPELQVLREPLPLRTLAVAPVDVAALLEHMVASWSRPLPPRARTLVKASSTCNVLAASLLARHPQGRAVLLDLQLPAYLATVLKSEAALADVLAAAPGRRRVLAADAAANAELAALDTAQQCAMGWLAEQVRFAGLASGPHADRVLRIDFERLLAAPHDTLVAIAAHLDLPATKLDAALASPWWGRYSKAGAHAYAAQDRQHDLALSRQRHGPAIAAAQAWLDAFLARRPELASRAGV
jgi:hypothetical protein